MSKSKTRTQYAALPVTVKDGQPLVMLITSRETRRWIIPKGWPEKKTKPYDVAAQEAFEEAGLVGRVEERPFGTFQYEKRLRSGRTTTCVVKVYRLEVERELDDWPEKGERERRWMAPDEAALLISEAGLVDLLRSLATFPL